MDITKAMWTTDSDSVHLSMPISKVDEEKRIVSGWASLDNADTQGDVVTAEANRSAFSRFRGNVREMHQPIAAGRMVSFKEDSFYDSKSEKFYNGIFVDVHVSKGAQATWEKVLDGTLQGFSIGGSIVDSETQFVKDAAGGAGKSIRFVKDYNLDELSLVDAPANSLANVFSIQKAADGSMIMKGMVAEAKMENVFYCQKDLTAKSSTEETIDCGFCGTTMENIGWYEYENDAEKVTKVAEIVGTLNKKQETATEEGGVNVADEKNAEETVEPGSTTVAVDEVVAQGEAEQNEKQSTEAVSNEEVTPAEDEEKVEKAEKAADVSEVAVEDPDFTKMFSDLKTAIEGGLTKNREAAEEAISKAVDEFNSKVGELVQKHDELTTKFASLKDEVDSVEKALKAVENETAVKKSGDLGGSTAETLSKRKDSIWGGSILRSTDL